MVLNSIKNIEQYLIILQFGSMKMARKGCSNSIACVLICFVLEPFPGILKHHYNARNHQLQSPFEEPDYVRTVLCNSCDKQRKL